MRKIAILILSLVATICIVASSFAKNYIGPVQLKGEKITVATALEAKSDIDAYIVGNIVNQLSYDEYKFEDSTGEMLVIIQNDVFPEKLIDENYEIYIIGQVNAFRRYPNKFYVEMIKLADE